MIKNISLPMQRCCSKTDCQSQSLESDASLLSKQQCKIL